MPRLGSRVRVPFSALYEIHHTGKQPILMNLYLRYFDREVLVTNVDDAIAFLAEIEEIGMNPVLERTMRK